MRHLPLGACAILGLLVAGCASTANRSAGVHGGHDHSGGHVVATAPGIDQPIVTQKIGRPYQVFGRWYTPARQDDYNAVGQASWYGAEFQGRPTANGEIFDKDKLTAAHPTLPIPSYIRVTNLDNGRTAILRVNDRGPFSRNRILDVSRRAAEELGFVNRGTANVRVSYLGPRENELGGGRMYTASADIPPEPVAAQPIAPTPAPLAAPPGGTAVTSAPITAVSLEPLSRPEEPPAPIHTASEAALAAGGWFVQAGAFSESQRAETVRARLGDVGPARVETVSVAGQTLHRVLVGPYPAELAANAVRFQMANDGFGDARLVLRN